MTPKPTDQPKEENIMKLSEVINANYDKIAESMIQHYRTVLESRGGVQYKIYIWSDGELFALEQVQGDNTRAVPNDMETRELFHVCTIACPCFDPWDAANESAPDDEDEREAQEEEIIDWLVSEYKNSIDDKLGEIISDAERDEMFEQ